MFLLFSSTNYNIRCQKTTRHETVLQYISRAQYRDEWIRNVGQEEVTRTLSSDDDDDEKKIVLIY